MNLKVRGISHSEQSDAGGLQSETLLYVLCVCVCVGGEGVPHADSPIGQRVVS